MEESTALVGAAIVDPNEKALEAEKRIAQLEQEFFNTFNQLKETRENLNAVNVKNSRLKEYIETLENEKLDRNRTLQTLEKNRDELIIDRTELQSSKILLQTQKDHFETETTKLLNEKRRLTDELQALKTDFNSFKNEHCLLKNQLADFENEKKLIEYDKERWNREKEILVQGKQWFMKEISSRETKINDLRIETMKLESKFQREQFALNEEREKLAVSVEELQEGMTKKEQELSQLRQRLHEIVEERATTLNEMDAELRTKERLAQVYRSSLDAANNEIMALKESEASLQAQLQEREISIVNQSSELEKIQMDQKNYVNEKESQIKNLKEELAKANELLKIGSKIHCSDEEIAALSPAAAAASSLIKSGITLSSIYAEHCRVVSELEKQKEENARIERYVSELVEELEAKAPLIKEQREVYENLDQQVKSLAYQNDLISQKRQELQNERDSAIRELTFTKAELVRYQHEHHALSIQVRRLLFVNDRGSNPSAYESEDTEYSDYVFSNIKELQEKNIELLSKIKGFEEEKYKTIMEYQNAEREQLTASLNATQQELERVKQHQGKLEMLVEELTAQRDNYKNLYEENGCSRNISPPSALNGTTVSSVAENQRRNSLDKVQSDLVQYKTKAEFLQDKLDFFTQDKQESDKALNNRIDQQMEQISQLRTTNGKLESSLEFQKKNQHLLNKQIEDLDRDLKKAKDGALKAESRLETLHGRFDDLTNQLLNKQQELSQLKVMNNSLEEQLMVSRGNEQRAVTELGILRDRSYSSERLALTLQEVESVLKRNDAQKHGSINSQLESACLERDNLKNLVENLNRQHSSLTNQLKLNLTTITSERDKAVLDCKNLRESVTTLETKCNALQEELNRNLNEAMASHPENDIDACKKEIQQLKNKTVYQEKQISELTLKCDEFEKIIEHKEQELMSVCSLSGNMENVIREQNEYGDLERQRLLSICNQAEKDLANSKQQIEELRNSVANLELQLLEKTRSLEQAETRLQEHETNYQQKLAEFETKEQESRDTFNQMQQVVEMLQSQHENNKENSANLSTQNEQLSKELKEAKAKLEQATKQIAELKEEYNLESAKLKNKLILLDQEKMHLTQEIAEFNKRDREQLEKTDTLYDEIQQLTQQISVMQNMQIHASGDLMNTSMNSSSLQESTSFDQTDRFTTIIGFMRAEKQKEIELRMNAELDLQRIKTQNSIDREKIGNLEAELNKARNLAQMNARAAKENEQLLTQMDVLRLTQQRYNLLKKEFDELNQRFSLVDQRAKEVEKQQLQSQAEKSNLESRLVALKSEVETRKKEILGLRQQNEKAMSLASKYSPESYTALQGECEKHLRDLNQKEKEIQLLNVQIEKCTNDISKLKVQLEEKENTITRTSNMLDQTRSLARNYRNSSQHFEKKVSQLEEEARKLKAEMEKSKTTQFVGPNKIVAAALGGAAGGQASVTAGWPLSGQASQAANAQTKKLLQDKIKEAQQYFAENQELKNKLNLLEAEKVTLETKLEALRIELDEANEKVFRMDSITSMLTQSRKRVDMLTEELKVKEAELVELKHQISITSRKRGLSAVDLPTSVMDGEEGETKRSRLSPFNAEQVSTSGVGNDEEQNNDELNRVEAANNKIDLFLNNTAEEGVDFTANKESEVRMDSDNQSGLTLNNQDLPQQLLDEGEPQLETNNVLVELDAENQNDHVDQSNALPDADDEEVIADTSREEAEDEVMGSSQEPEFTEDIYPYEDDEEIINTEADYEGEEELEEFEEDDEEIDDDSNDNSFKDQQQPQYEDDNEIICLSDDDEIPSSSNQQNAPASTPTPMEEQNLEIEEEESEGKIEQ